MAEKKPRKPKVFVPVDKQIAAVVQILKGDVAQEIIAERYNVGQSTVSRWKGTHAQLAKRMIDLERKADEPPREEPRPPFDKRIFPSPVVPLRETQHTQRTPPPPRTALEGLIAERTAHPDDPGAYARRIMASRHAPGGGAPGELERLARENAELRAELARVTEERDAMVEAHQLLASEAYRG